MILLVDDDEALRAATRELLERAGLVVVDRGGGEGALDLLARRGAAVDLLLTDYRMPGMDGLELAARARALRPDLRVLVVTSDPDARLEASGLPAIAKSRSGRELVRRIAEVCAADPIAAPPPRPGPRAAIAGLAALVVAALAAAAVWWVEPRPPALPDPRIETTLRSGTVDALSPEGPLAESPGALRWQGVSGAALYEARIEEVDGSLLWSASAAGSSVELPDGLRRSLRPYVAYHWRVDARDDAGRRVAASAPVRFRVIPPLPTDRSERP